MTTKAETAYNYIADRINSHQYSPGQRLVLQTIASDLDMSVVPVREAVRKLEATGLVTFQPNVGASVALNDESMYLQSMQVLAVMEGAATALAARNVAPTDIAVARAINDEMRDCLIHFDAVRFTQLNRRFHEVLFAVCANRRLRALVEAEWAQLDRVRATSFTFIPDRSPQSVEEHEHLLQLIEKQAPLAEIEQAARDHRNHTIDAYITRQHPGHSTYVRI